MDLRPVLVVDIRESCLPRSHRQKLMHVKCFYTAGLVV